MYMYIYIYMCMCIYVRLWSDQRATRAEQCPEHPGEPHRHRPLRDGHHHALVLEDAVGLVPLDDRADAVLLHHHLRPHGVPGAPERLARVLAGKPPQDGRAT